MFKFAVHKLTRILPLFILVGAFPFFFLGGTLESSSSLLSAIWDCGHVVFFIALVVLISRKVDVNNWRVALIITATVFFAGGLIEVIQASIGRDGNWDDLLRDLTGTWLGLFWLQRSTKWVLLGRVFATVLLIPNITAVFMESWYEARARHEFPLLVGFESVIESYWGKKEDERSTQYRTQGEYSLKVVLSPKNYSGIKFSRLQQDWRGFKQFGFDIYNPDSTSFYMTVRVNDVQHGLTQWAMKDRFNTSFQLKPGWNHLSYSMDAIEHAPAGRLMDLSHITWVEIFVGKLPESRIIYLDNLRLE
ncbi:hypothetical protein GCM10011613_20470 [Cellvibrio zantedeschiae]|uniref:VanZ-like domain-containing protein n=1 Tax=Cellvibrio zantedeschiae TaxID=1237077 RepID=A0ABQ3B2F1_9GAMM|nr:hypothetical protein [Cellvibrio zantedeschiae]GGY74904.1 hypothetical protein GCM10011613_20470 [Cellvibrio zantedeschiae]